MRFSKVLKASSTLYGPLVVLHLNYLELEGVLEVVYLKSKFGIQLPERVHEGLEIEWCFEQVLHRLSDVANDFRLSCLNVSNSVVNFWNRTPDFSSTCTRCKTSRTRLLLMHEYCITCSGLARMCSRLDRLPPTLQVEWPKACTR